MYTCFHCITECWTRTFLIIYSILFFPWPVLLCPTLSRYPFLSLHHEGTYCSCFSLYYKRPQMLSTLIGCPPAWSLIYPFNYINYYSRRVFAMIVPLFVLYLNVVLFCHAELINQIKSNQTHYLMEPILVETFS